MKRILNKLAVSSTNRKNGVKILSEREFDRLVNKDFKVIVL